MALESTEGQVHYSYDSCTHSDVALFSDNVGRSFGLWAHILGGVPIDIIGKGVMALCRDIWEAAELSEHDKSNLPDAVVRKFDDLWEKIKNETDEKENCVRKCNDEFQLAIAQKDTELNSLKLEVSKLGDHLSTAVNPRPIFLKKEGIIEDSDRSEDQTNLLNEQDIRLLNNRVAILSKDLTKYKLQIGLIQEQQVSLECEFKLKLSDKELELQRAKQKNEDLMKIIEVGSDVKNNISVKSTESQTGNTILQDCKKELEAKTSLNQMNTNLLKEAKEKCDNIKNEVEELKIENVDIIDKFNKKEDELNQLKIETVTCKERYEQIISSLNSDLEKVNKQVLATREENFGLFLEDFAPEATNVCNLIKKKSLVEIFRQISEINQEKFELFREKESLSLERNRLSVEIDNKNSLLEDLTSKYEKLSKSNSVLTKGFQNLSQENEILNREKEENLNLYIKTNKENNNLKKEIFDLSKQTYVLLKKIYSKIEPSFLSVDLMEPLLIFENIEQLQNNNLSLMKLVNELKDKFKEYTIKAMEINEESQIIDDLKEKIINLERESNFNLIIIRAEIQQKEYFERINNDLNNKIASLELRVNMQKKALEIDPPAQLKDALNKLEKMKVFHNKYKKERDISEQMLSDALEELRVENNRLTTQYEKASSKSKFVEEQLETMQKVNQSLRNQRAGLEGRICTYQNSIFKQDAVITTLQTEILDESNNNSVNKSNLRTLRKEYKFLMDSHERMKSERDVLRKERMWQSKDLQFMKASIEKGEIESSILINSVVNTLEAKNAKLKQEMEKQQEQRQEMQGKLQENQNILNDKDAEIESLNKQIENTNIIIENLDKRILDLANDSLNNKPEWELKVKDLEDKLQDYQRKNCELMQNCSKSNEEIKSLRVEKDTISEKLLNLEKVYSDYKEKSEKKFEIVLKTSNELKEQIDDLKIITDQSSNQSIEDNIIALNNANKQIESLRKDIIVNEEKFVNEMGLRLNDIQKIMNLKEQLSELKDEIKGLKSENITLKDTVSDLKNKFVSREKELLDICDDSKNQLVELKRHNSLIHQELQTQDSNNSEHLLEIIKHLNKEKEFLDTKYATISLEINRLKLEMKTMEKKTNELIVKLAESEKVNASLNESLAAMPTPEILAKIDLLNTMTDSNAVLRSENEKLSILVNEISDSCNDLDIKLKNIKKEYSELMLTMKDIQNENDILRTEIGRWRSRVNFLVEKVNKRSPEDWKRLQYERETLANMLTIEKDRSRKVNEFVSKTMIEKISIQEKLNNKNVKFESLREDLNKKIDEINILKEYCSKISSELISAKTSNAEMSEAMKILDVKNVKIEELSMREDCIKPIAVKYKTAYQEFNKTVESKKFGYIDKDAIISDAEKQMLTKQIAVYQDKKQIEVMYKNPDNIEKIKHESEAQAKIIRLNKTNVSLITSLAEPKNSYESIEEELKSNFQTLQLQHDEEITNIKREDDEKRSAMPQLTVELDTLKQQKVGYGQRSWDDSVKSRTGFEQRETEVQQIHRKSLQSGIATSEILSSPNNSQNVIDFPIKSNVPAVPPESTLEATTNPKNATVDSQVSNLTSNINNSNSTITTPNDESENKISHKRTHQDGQAENTSDKRLKIQRAVESELEYEVPTLLRGNEDDCAIVANSRDDEKQCDNRGQTKEKVDDEKVVQSALSPENQCTEFKEEFTSVASGNTSENNEVEVASPLDIQEETGLADLSEVRTEDSGVLHSPNSMNQISSVTGDDEVGSTKVEGGDGVVQSTPLTPGDELLPGSSKSIKGKAIKSSETEKIVKKIDKDPMVSQQSSLPTAPAQQIKDTRDEVAGSAAATTSGNSRRGQGQRYHSQRGHHKNFRKRYKK